MPISDDNLIALSAFAEIAEQYCRFVDSLQSGRPAGLYAELERLLCELHSAVLPVRSEGDIKTTRRFKKKRMTHEQWSQVASRIKEIVGPETAALFEYHQQLGAGSEPKTEGVDSEAVRAVCLWDDLAGIYCDLSDGLVLWRLGTPEAQAEAAWRWRWCYENHWGRHSFHAMLTVHEARYQLEAE